MKGAERWQEMEGVNKQEVAIIHPTIAIKRLKTEDTMDVKNNDLQYEWWRSDIVAPLHFFSSIIFLPSLIFPHFLLKSSLFPVSPLSNHQCLKPSWNVNR